MVTKPSITSTRQNSPLRRQPNQQVSWWSVHEYITTQLDGIDRWPPAGTPAWCELPDDDPAKIAALFDAAQHWALRLETGQQAMAEASHGISAAADWPAIAKEYKTLTDFYEARPWLKRAAS